MVVFYTIFYYCYVTIPILMSSIYRKGRDGYFYYQTYLKNPETGKKDKKIYASLGTKNREEAIKKKGELDLKYAEEEKIYRNKKNIFLVKNKKIGFVIAITIILTVFATKESLERANYEESSLKKIDTESTYNKINDNLMQKNQDLNSENKLNDTIMLKSSDYSNPIVNDISSSSDNKKIELTTDLKEVEKIPSYTIERVEYFSSAFKQARIFLTVVEKSNSNSLRLLCREVKKNHAEYSNILICLYQDSYVGKKLAKGDFGVDINDNQGHDAWIAMYTYNEVEGEYFDDNPTSHLRSY